MPVFRRAVGRIKSIIIHHVSTRQDNFIARLFRAVSEHCQGRT
jgi:hypothetical protein